MFAALAENFGDVENKINLFVALAPIANFERCSNQALLDNADEWELRNYQLTSLGIFEI